MPTRAEGDLVGYINNVDLTDASISATMLPTADGATEIRGVLNNLPPSIGKILTSFWVRIRLYFH